MNIMHIFVFAVLTASVHNLARLISRRLQLSRLLGSSLFVAILISATLFSSCTDEADNPVTPVPEPVETEKQTQFWSKFDKWQTDSCTVGDDFYMHMLHYFWWNPNDIYPDGMLNYAQERQLYRVMALELDDTDADVKILNDLCKKASAESRVSEEDLIEILSPRVEELWQNATTMEQAMEAWGRATAAGYNDNFAPVPKIVGGKPEWVMSECLPIYYDDSALLAIWEKQELERHYAYHGGQVARSRASAQADAYITAFVKGMGLGIPADERIWEDGTKETFYEAVNHFATVKGVKNEIMANVLVYDGLLISDDMLETYSEYKYKTSSGKEVTLSLPRKKLMENIEALWGALYRIRAFNKKYITADMKRKYEAYCEDFRTAFQKRLENSSWLSEETRTNALEKLKNVEFFVDAEPDFIPDVATPKLKNEGIITLVRQLRQARMDTYKWMIGRSRREVLMLMGSFEFTTDCLKDNAYYQASSNMVCIHPSNLLPPYIQDGDEEPLTMAILGSTIGHELTHGFDVRGRYFDKYGTVTDWWAPADTVKFNAFSEQLVKNYSALLIMPWVDQILHDNGSQTLSENIADIGGCCLGLDLLLSKHPNASPEEIKQLTKRYFQAWAISWSGKYDMDHISWALDNDNHSLLRERTNGVLRNINAWYDAYDVKSGTLYLEPSERIAIW